MIQNRFTRLSPGLSTLHVTVPIAAAHVVVGYIADRLIFDGILVFRMPAETPLQNQQLSSNNDSGNGGKIRCIRREDDEIELQSHCFRTSLPVCLKALG